VDAAFRYIMHAVAPQVHGDFASGTILSLPENASANASVLLSARPSKDAQSLPR
jgi:hypothetical protein